MTVVIRNATGRPQAYGNYHYSKPVNAQKEKTALKRSQTFKHVPVLGKHFQQQAYKHGPQLSMVYRNTKGKKLAGAPMGHGYSVSVASGPNRWGDNAESTFHSTHQSLGSHGA